MPQVTPLDVRDFEAIHRLVMQTKARMESLHAEQKHCAARRSRASLNRMIRLVHAHAAEHGYLADIVAPIAWCVDDD